MSTHSDVTRNQRHEAARQARLERKRRLAQLGGVLGGAAVIVAIAIAASSGGGSGSAATGAGESVVGQIASRQLLNGIPQSGLTLGNPNAKVTMVEFADTQCPFCRSYALDVLPRLVQDYVRTGKVKMVFRPLAFIGPDSQRAARAALAAGAQNRLWNYLDLIYYNQGRENSGYATDAYLAGLGNAVPGLNVSKALAARQSTAVTGDLAAANALATRYGVNSTPTFVITPGSKAATKPTAVTNASFGALKAAIDSALKA